MLQRRLGALTRPHVEGDRAEFRPGPGGHDIPAPATAHDGGPRVRHGRTVGDHELRAIEPRGALRNGRRLAREQRLVHQQRGRRDEAQVCRDARARLEQDEVAGHELAAVDVPLPAVTHRPRVRGDQVHQRAHRRLGPALLHETDHGVQDEDGRDHDGVGVLAKQDREHRREQQDVDERAAELVEEDRQDAGRPNLLELVRAVTLQPTGDVGRRQAARARAEERLDFGVIERMPWRRFPLRCPRSPLGRRRLARARPSNQPPRLSWSFPTWRHRSAGSVAACRPTMSRSVRGRHAVLVVTLRRARRDGPPARPRPHRRTVCRRARA